jgi:hypothetical protein
MRAPGESVRGQDLSGRVLEPPGRGAVQPSATPEGPRDGEVVRHAAHLWRRPGRNAVKVPQTTRG